MEYEYFETAFGPCEGLYGGCEGVGEWTIDPFIEEIWGEQIYRYLCENCYSEKCYDI